MKIAAAIRAKPPTAPPTAPPMVAAFELVLPEDPPPPEGVEEVEDAGDDEVRELVGKGVVVETTGAAFVDEAPVAVTVTVTGEAVEVGI